MYKVRARDRVFIVNTIRRIFPDSTIFVFGSRISGTANKYSDLDLAIKTKKSKLVASKFLDLQTVFAESDLPFKVDISDFAVLSEDFKRNALKNAETWGD